MRYDERLQALVLRVLHHTGLMSEGELLDYIKETLSEVADTSGLEVAHVHLALQRWKARGAVSVQVIDSITRYKVAKIPPWFASCNMANLVKITGKEAREYIKRLDEEIGGGATVVPTSGKYIDVKKVEITFETVTEILGTKPDGGMHRLYRDRDGKIFIPISWQKGYLRSNAPMIDGTGSLQHHVGVGIGYFEEEEVKLDKISAYPHPKSKGGKSPGEVIYEAIAPGQRFKTIWYFPMKGTKIRNVDNLREWLGELGISPIRGMGGNPHLKGGLIMPVEVKELPAMSFM